MSSPCITTSKQPGTIVQINISAGGLPKRPIESGIVTLLGLEGDAHRHTEVHGGPEKAILIVASEVVDDLTERGWPLFYGALGENFTTRGLDFQSLRLGDELQAGSAVLQITRPRVPCTQLHVFGDELNYEIFDKGVQQKDPSSPRWGKSGFYTRVITPGAVTRGDIIALVPKST
jgi:MOSC domain-containing protein YiiM